MDSRKCLLTDEVLRRLQPGASGERVTVYDTKVPGLWVRRGATAVSFLVVGRLKGGDGRPQKLTLGHWPQLSLTKARERAKEWLAQLRMGEDPRQLIKARGAASVEAKRATQRTFAVVWSEWAQTTAGGLSPATMRDRALTRRYLEQAPLMSVPFGAVGRKEVDATFRPLFDATRVAQVDGDGRLLPRAPLPAWLPTRTLSGATARKIYAYARAAWHHAATMDEVQRRNPFDDWRHANARLVPTKVKRTGHLRTDKPEGAQCLEVIEAARRDENPTVACMGDYVLMVLLWGGRRLETMRLRWGDIDFDERRVLFRPEHVKSRKLQVLPLTPWATEVLQARRMANVARSLSIATDDWVFASRRRSRAQAAEVRAAEAMGRPPADWATSTTHIKSAEEVLDRIEQRLGRRVTLHDLRRTVASELTLRTAILEVASQALNHAGHGGFAQTADYVQVHAKVEALRPSFERHEDHLRHLIGLPSLISPTTPPVTTELTEAQKSLLEMARTLFKQANMPDLLPPT